MFEKKKKRENVEIKDILHKSPCKKSYLDIEVTACYSELMSDRDRADIIDRIWRISPGQA